MRRLFFLILIVALAFPPNAGALLLRSDQTNLPKVINDKVSFQQVVAELPKTCPDCTDRLNGKNFDPDESAKIQETIAETARIHGLTLNEFLIIADKNGLYGLHNGNDGGTVAVNALRPDGSGFSSGKDRVFTFGHESPGHSSGGAGEEYADLMGSYALGAMNLSNWLNGRERLSDSSLSATDWLAAYGDSDFIRYNNAWGNFLAEQKDTHKREDGYDRHALGQKTYEELLATDIAMDERYKDDWGHVTGPMLAMGHAGKGLYEFGGLWLQWGVNVLSSGEYYPDAPKQLSYTILSIPENLSDGFAQALQDFSSGDTHRIFYGATNLAMIFSPYIAGKAGETGLAVGGGAGGRAAYLDDAAGAPAAERGAAAFGPAHNAAIARRLAEDLKLQEASSIFMPDGKLKPGVVNNAREIIPPARLNNELIPDGYGKYATTTTPSPSGNFQVHFYKNVNTGHVFYELDYKIKFDNEFWWKK